MSKRMGFGAAAKLRLDAEIRAARACAADEETLHAYERLLDVARRFVGVGGNVALLAMAMRHADWVRSPEDWTAAARSERAVVGELAAHVFARYAMPPCMANGWLAGELGERRVEHEWYVRLGQGENIRRVGVPVPLTRAAAHAFTSAPAHLSVVAALRWAQLRVLDAAPELTRAVLESALARTLDDEANEAFWLTVLHFFVNHPELPVEQVGPIVDYLRVRRIDGEEGLRDDGTFGRQPPAEPTFSMKGRSPAALMRLVGTWHQTLGRQRVRSVTWAAAPFGGFTWVEHVPVKRDKPDAEPRTEPRAWTIAEIRSTSDLVEEGRAMHHCVAMYADACVAGRRSIWSLRLQTTRMKRRVLTIEVDLKCRKIIQARRKCNAMPSFEERALLRRWAERERLSLVSSLQRED